MRPSCSCFYLTCSAVIIALPLVSMTVHAQQLPGLRETRSSSGSQSTFSYRIQTTYGTTTSIQVTGNVKADAEAVLKLKSGSKITNKMGDAAGNASAVFVATPTGGNVDLKGITGENMFLIDDGTYFRSSVAADGLANPASTVLGTASATATHTTTVTVERGTTTFENFFEQTF